MPISIYHISSVILRNTYTLYCIILSWYCWHNQLESFDIVDIATINDQLIPILIPVLNFGIDMPTCHSIISHWIKESGWNNLSTSLSLQQKKGFAEEEE